MADPPVFVLLKVCKEEAENISSGNIPEAWYGVCHAIKWPMEEYYIVVEVVVPEK